jgi:putative ubiquitin-RnfH superfamily antitoxin RatB of RatAB toxin-antitoxin module
MRVTVAFALAGRQEVFEVDLAAGATLADAIAAAPLGARFPGVDLDSLDAGIWGVRAARDTLLREGDRVELYRPLQADPKEMRRRRVKPRT